MSLMKIVRFQDLAGNVHYGEWIKEWSALLIEKTVDETYAVTDHVVAIDKLLAPVEPPSILCVGLNYRRHAEETGARIPEYPVLFIKAASALNNPGDPIVIPKSLRAKSIAKANWRWSLESRGRTSNRTKPSITCWGTRAPMTSAPGTGKKRAGANNGAGENPSIRFALSVPAWSPLTRSRIPIASRSQPR